MDRVPSQQELDEIKLQNNQDAIEQIEFAIEYLNLAEEVLIDAEGCGAKVDSILLKIENLGIDMRNEIESIERMGVHY